MNNMKRFLLKSKSFAITLLIVNLLFTGAAFGQTNTWDGSGGANWTTTSSWSLNHVPLATEDVVIPNNFAVTVNTAAVCKSLTLTGGGNDVTVTISSTNSLSVTNGISIGAGTGMGDNIILAVGSGSLSCASITVTATGSNSRSSGVTLSTGTVTVTGNVTMGDVNDDFSFSSTGTLFVGGTMTGGTLTPSTGTVDYNNAGDQTVGAYTYNNLTLSGSGTKTLAGAVTVSGLLTAGTGTTLDMINTNMTVGGITGSGDMTHLTGIPGNRTLTVNGTINPAAYSGILSNGTATSVLLTKSGTGTLTLSGANTYSGATTISGGTLSINTIADAGTSSSIGTGSTTSAISITSATGILKYTGTGHTSNRAITLTVDGPTIDASGTGTLTLTGGVTGVFNLNLIGTGAGIESGVIATGAGSTLTKNGTGSWALTGANTFSGAVTITSGTLIANTLANAGTNSSLGTGSTTSTISIAGSGILQYTGTGHSTSRPIALTADGATIDASGSGTLTLSGAVSGNGNNLVLTGTGIGIENGIIGTTSGTLTKNGTGTWRLGAANTFTGTTTINDGILQYTVANALSNGAVTVNGGTYDIATFNDAVGTVTLISGSISGTTGVLTGTSYAMQSGTASAILGGAGVTLTKTTSGTVTLSGTNTYTGATTISAGTLIASNTQALGTVAGAVNLNGGVLDLATDASVLAYNFVVGGNASIVSNRATAGAGITHALGTLSIGNFTLSETVGTNVNSGTAALSFGTTTLSAATPKFDVASGADLTLGALTNNNAFTKQGAGQLILNTASVRTSGTVTLTAGTMKLGNAAALGTTGVPLQLNGGTLDLAINSSVNAYNTTVGGSVSIVSNRSTSGAAITHTLGTLSIGNFTLTSSYGANVSSGTAGLIFGTTTLTANAPVFDIENNVDLTLGALGGNFAFSKQNNGLLILNTAANANRTSAAVTINTGSIRLGSASALGTAGVPIILNTGSGLNLAINTTVNAHPVTVNGNATIISNRSTSGAGITHTLGTLSIGNSSLAVLYGDNVNDATAGVTFGATTFSGATPMFDATSGGVNITLGALSGNFAFTKIGGGVLTLNTASARTGGTATLENGTLSLGIANALGTSTVPLQLNGGVLDLAINSSVNAYNTTVGGNVIITSNRSTSGAGITHVLGTLNIGTNTLSVNKGANATGAAAVQFGNLTMSGAPILSPNTADLVMAGTASGAFKLTKSGAGTLQKTTTGWTLGSDFEITAGTYDATTQNTTLLGDWLNNGGTLAASGSSAVIFNGSAAQSIGGSSATTFNNLIVDNPNGVILGNNETVNATVTLTNGNLVVPTSNTLTIANGNAVSGSGFSASKSIVTQVNTGTGAKGFVRVNNLATSAAYLLPVSDGTNYLPVTLTPTDVPANNTFNVCVFQGITADGEPNGTAFTTPQKNNCVDAVWTVNYNGPGTPTAAAVDMKVEWPASLEGVNFAGYSNVVIGIAHWDGPNWGQVVGTGDNTNNNAIRTNITQFSPFAVGRIDPTGGVLAIKINYFNASKGNGFNTLNWQAACSSSQAIFELERSVDGVNFTNINSITASQARCASPFSYNDNTAPAGTVFYRIRIIDVDGKASYSAIVKLSSQVKDIELSGITPNPVMNIAQVKVNTIKKDVVNLVVIAADGKVVSRTSVQLQAGSSIISVDIANLPSGVYMLKGIFSDGQTNTVKFIKQ